MGKKKKIRDRSRVMSTAVTRRKNKRSALGDCDPKLPPGGDGSSAGSILGPAAFMGCVRAGLFPK